MVYGYLTAQMILTALCVIMLLKYHGRLLILQWSITMTEDLLDGLMVECPLRSSNHPDKQIGPEQGDIWKLVANTEELGTWTGHFTGINRSYSNYFFHYNQSYFIQAYVPLPFVVVIGNLQFNKTLRSVTCINCKLYTCLNSSISLRNDSLLISSILT